MKPLRNIFAVAVALALLAGRAPATFAADAADSAAAPPAQVAQGTSWSFEGTASYHAVDHPYFGARERRGDWGEGFQKLRVNRGFAGGAWFGIGGIGMLTAGTDYYGVHDAGDGRLDQLVIGAANVGGSGIAVTAGRQDLVLGDGFLIGDGYLDRRAALWNIPLNFYDALRVDWKAARGHALVFGANLSRSFGCDGVYPRGEIVGGELGAAPDGNSDVTATVLRRIDDGSTNHDETALSLRFLRTHGSVTITGEGVLERGTRWDVTQRGHGGHVRLEYAPKARLSPVGKLEYFLFSGDDPATAADEGYDPWQFRWNDWEQYYVGDLLASTVGTSSNMRIARAQLGCSPREGTGVRLLLHRMDRDRAPAAGAPAAFAYEYDVVVDQAFGGHWSAWVMGAYVSPLATAKVEAAARGEYGSASGGQVFTSVSWKFGSQGGAE